MNLLSQLFGSTAAQLDPQALKERMAQKPGPFLLDVRQPDEFKDGHIAGAHLIPLDQLSARIKELPAESEIVCICRSGSRSAAAARQLSAAGLKPINLRGGMIAWKNAGFPIQKGLR